MSRGLSSRRCARSRAVRLGRTTSRAPRPASGRRATRFGGECWRSPTPRQRSSSASRSRVFGPGLSAAAVALLFVPVWIVAAKLYGLYDRDHRSLGT